MVKPPHSLADVQKELAHIQSVLRRTLPAELARVPRFGFFRSWQGKIEELTACVGTLARQVDRLSQSVDTICDVLKQDDEGRCG